MQGKVEICSVNTARLPRLSGEETEKLLRKAKDGDRDAREKLISGNLRLVLSVIQKFTGRGENADDLFQVGCVGLIKAIDNFDPSHEVRFSTYGVPMNIPWGNEEFFSVCPAGQTLFLDMLSCLCYIIRTNTNSTDNIFW